VLFQAKEERRAAQRNAYEYARAGARGSHAASVEALRRRRCPVFAELPSYAIMRCCPCDVALSAQTGEKFSPKGSTRALRVFTSSEAYARRAMLPTSCRVACLPSSVAEVVLPPGGRFTLSPARLLPICPRCGERETQRGVKARAEAMPLPRASRGRRCPPGAVQRGAARRAEEGLFFHML